MIARWERLQTAAAEVVYFDRPHEKRIRWERDGDLHQIAVCGCARCVDYRRALSEDTRSAWEIALAVATPPGNPAKPSAR